MVHARMQPPWVDKENDSFSMVDLHPGHADVLRGPPMFSSLGSLRLPLPPSRRHPRRRPRRRLDDAGLPDGRRAQLGRLARRRFGIGRRSPSASTPSSAPGRSSVIALFRSDDAGRGRHARPSSRAPIADVARRGRDGRPRVSGIVGYAETGDRRFISTAGDAAYVVIELDMTDEESVDHRRGAARRRSCRRPATRTS